MPALRRILAADLSAHSVGAELRHEAEIVVTELAANSVRHARPLPDGRIRARWRVKDGLVEVEVCDGGGATAPVACRVSPLASNGRGLRVVRSIAHEWGVRDDAGTRTVWAALGGPSRRRV